jgi:predicted component of type VI protein secretion system
MGKLVLFRADGTTQDVKLDRERITIGRRPDNDLCLPHAAVSGEHAVVVTILGDSFLEDLGSTNGTLVNGKPVAKHFLRDRDQIDIGREILVYVEDDAATIAVPPHRPERAAAVDGTAADADRQSAAAAQRDKRRSDGLPTITGDAVGAIQRVVAAEIEGSAAEPSGSPPTQVAASVDPAPGNAPAIRVRSGFNAGRVLRLTGVETVIGRAGVQVVAVRRTADEVRVVPIEGAIPPTLNGRPIPPDGKVIKAGDILDIVGATLEFVPPEDAAA